MTPMPPGPAGPDPSGGPTVRLGDRDVPVIRFTGALPEVATVAARLAEAGLPSGERPVVVLVGGADGLRIDDEPAWEALFRHGLVTGLQRTGSCLVDGGTEAGVLGRAAEARAQAGADYPVVGVVAEGTVHWPGHEPARADAASIGTQHTHLVTVPGAAWGLDPPWIARVASALAGPAGSVTVVVNGGKITVDDVRESLRAGRRTLVVAGTGRLADALAAARRGESGPTATEQALAASPLLQIVDGLRAPGLLADAIADALGEHRDR